MALTTAQQVRLRIQDNYRYGNETLYGDGTASAFKLQQGQPYSTLRASATASISTTAGWSATGCTIDHTLGRAIFSARISANSAVMVDYQWSVFSDDEIGHFTAVGGTVVGASIEAVRTLMFDYAKRGRWGAPDGTNYDDTKALDNLRAILGDLTGQQDGAGGEPAGAGITWPEEQQYYQY